MWTLSALQLHQHALIVVDEDATLELQVKTVKYFKSIEQVANSEGFGQALPSEELTLKKRDSVLQELDSPTSPRSNNLLAPSKPTTVRAVTPDLVPDSMHGRIPEEPLDLDGVPGPEQKDVSLQAMHSRVDPSPSNASVGAT